MLLTPDLFLECITLVIQDSTGKASALVMQLTDLYESESRTGALSAEDELIRFYIRMLKTILINKTSKETPDELRMILLKFKSDPTLAQREEIYNLLHDTFMSQEKMTKSRRDTLLAHVTNTLSWFQINRKIKMVNGAMWRASDLIDPDDQQNELQRVRELLKESIQVSDAAYLKEEAKGLIEQINFSKKEDVKNGLGKFNERNVKGVLKMGLQGLNKMCGEHKGLVRGESVVFNALSHNYKSGILVSIAVWTAIYNVPTNADKKALIYLVSLENEAHQNLMDAFRHHYHLRTGKAPIGLSDDEISDWICDFFSQNGFELIVERYMPSEFGAQEYENRINYFESIGYEVYLAAIDYMNNMKKENEQRDLAVRSLYRRMCSFNSSKGVTMVTAHQLNRKAQELVSSGITNAVKRFSSDMLTDSSDVQREVDLAVYMNIEKNHLGQKYLTFNRDKHRYVNNTPEAHKYFAYPFEGEMGIVDDVLAKPRYTRDIFTHEMEQAIRASVQSTVAGLTPMVDALY